MIDKEKMIKLENYIFEHHKKPGLVAAMMSEIVGVLVDLKPAAIVDFDGDEILGSDPNELIELFESVGLKVLFFKRYVNNFLRVKCEVEMYVSKDFGLAAKLYDAFGEMRKTIDDFGQVYREAEWQKATREIGELLGYPKTAVEEFLVEQDIDNPERQERMARNRYYAHSKEHEEQEFFEYDFKLNKAISEFAPKTLEIKVADKGKRWLEY